MNLFPSPTLTTHSSSKTLPTATVTATKRRAIVFSSSLVVASWLNFLNFNSTQPLSLSQQLQDELQQQEDHLVHLFQVFLFFMTPLYSNFHYFLSCSVGLHWYCKYILKLFAFLHVESNFAIGSLALKIGSVWYSSWTIFFFGRLGIRPKERVILGTNLKIH